jgi:hypothetical protein
MVESAGLTWPVVLAFCNLIFSSAIVITAFSLLGYVLTRNLRSPVARTFGVLLACVLLVSATDIIIPRVESHPEVLMWLRVQWIGIALVPAGYLHFSDAVLRTTRHFSVRRRAVVAASYVFSLILVSLALFTDALVYNGRLTPPITHLSAGPLFPIFVAYFVGTAVYGGWNVIRARRRCLTPASRRRMTYLIASFAAPGLGVFPYLLTSGLLERLSLSLTLLLNMAANIAVGTMLIVMAYSVTYLGVLTADRVIKHDLVDYLLRGPVVGIAVIVVMLVIPRVELILGLPRDTALVFAIVGVIVIGQLAVNAAKPWIDRLLYPEDREEIAWIQALDRRLLTSSDLRQFLTNLLIGLCEMLRVRDGFVLMQTDNGLRVEATAGDAEVAGQYAASPVAQVIWQQLAGIPPSAEDSAAPSFRPDTGYWFAPLRSQDGEKLLGVLAVRARTAQVVLGDDESVEVEALLTQAAAAVADRHVQEGVFATLQSILPDLERIQEWRSAVRYAPPLPTLPVEEPELRDESEQILFQHSWQQWVKDALSHYWGGPKLTESPLMELRVVKQRVKANDGNLTRALRAALQEAIERQRPPGERKLTASEWLVYNILDMRFVQGLRVIDIARRLALSESDLYRKQRVAVAAVARTLAEMEAALEAEDRQSEGAVVRESDSAIVS